MPSSAFFEKAGGFPYGDHDGRADYRADCRGRNGEKQALPDGGERLRCGQKLLIVVQRKVARSKAIAAQLDDRRGDDGKVWHADDDQDHKRHPQPRAELPRSRQLRLCRAAALAADETVAFFVRNIILQQPHYHADADQDRRKTRRTAEIDGRGGGIAMDIGGEHIETDAPPQGIGRAVFGKRLHEHQKRADGIVSREQRRENFPQPQAEARAEDRAALLQTGRNVQHGVFEHGHKEREHVQAHDQHQPAKAEKALRPRARRRKQLLEQALFLHEQDPAHRRDIRRRHERDHEDDIQPAVLFELRAREKKGRRHSDDGRAQHDAHAEQQRIADRLHVFRAGNGPPRLIQVKAAIDDDRLGKNCDQGTENEAGQKRQQEKPWEIFFEAARSHSPSVLTGRGC